MSILIKCDKNNVNFNIIMISQSTYYPLHVSSYYHNDSSDYILSSYSESFHVFQD